MSSATQELTAQERALIASLVTHNPVLGYAVGHYNDNAEEDSVTCFYTGDVNQTKSFMNIPTYNPTQYSWDTRHKYKCGLVSFHAHSGIPCTETRIGRERMSGYVERSTATYNYENVPYSAYATYIKYILSRGITYMNKDNDYDIETYDFYFCVNGQNGSLTLSYSDGTVDVMHIFS